MIRPTHIGVTLALLLTLSFTNGALAQAPGSPAPPFTLVDGDGQVVRLEDFEGTPLVLNAWATWCPFCIEEIPLFQRASDDVNSGGTVVSFLLVNLAEPFEPAKRFIDEEVGTTLRTAYDASDAQREQFDVVFDETQQLLSRDYRVRGMPTTFFIDADGIIQAVKIGPISEGELADRLADLGVEWRR